MDLWTNEDDVNIGFSGCFGIAWAAIADSFIRRPADGGSAAICSGRFAFGHAGLDQAS